MYSQIYEKAKKDFAESPSKVPKPYCDGMRKNLYVLLGRSDQVELMGQLADFGSTEDITEALTLAQENLIKLGLVFGLDLFAPAVKAATAEKTVPAKINEKADDVEGGGNGSGIQSPAQKLPPEKPADEKLPTDDKQKKLQGDDDPPEMKGWSKEDVITFYKKRLDECTSPAERNAFFNRRILKNAALEGKDKGVLSGYKAEVDKRVKSAGK